MTNRLLTEFVEPYRLGFKAGYAKALSEIAPALRAAAREVVTKDESVILVIDRDLLDQAIDRQRQIVAVVTERGDHDAA
jgi:hypothetical protein